MIVVQFPITWIICGKIQGSRDTLRIRSDSQLTAKGGGCHMRGPLAAVLEGYQKIGCDGPGKHKNQ